MSDAFQCDECNEFYTGDPVETVYNREMGQRGHEYSIRAELCGGCSDSFAGGRDEVDDED